MTAPTRRPEMRVDGWRVTTVPSGLLAIWAVLAGPRWLAALFVVLYAVLDATSDRLVHYQRELIEALRARIARLEEWTGS